MPLAYSCKLLARSAIAGHRLLKAGHAKLPLAELLVLARERIGAACGNNDGSMEIYDPAFPGFGAYAHVLPESDPCIGLAGQILSSRTRAALFRTGHDPLLDRTGHTITELNGQALVLGGANGGGTVLSSSSIVASSSASITTDRIDYSPGETAQISGQGFQPGETVRLKVHEDHTHRRKEGSIRWRMRKETSPASIW